MAEVLFVYASKAEKEPIKMIKNYEETLDFDVAFLCSEKKDKILKKDVDLDLSIFDKYKVVCPVGADSLKYSIGMTGITKYNGMFIEKKYIPVIHPNLTVFKPQYEDDIYKAIQNILKVVNGEIASERKPKNYSIIETTQEFDKYFEELNKAEKLVVDIETTSLSPRKGNVIGIAFSTKINEGMFVTSDICNIYKEKLHNLFLEKKCIFHNCKFDVGFLNYEFGFEFPDFEDTMLLHYCLEEALGTHGLKALALRFTDLGDYEKELDDYKKSFARQNKIKLADFNYGMIPMDILAPYACQDADGTFQLFEKFYPRVTNNQRFNNLYNNILKPATKTLLTLENNGGPIDSNKLNSIKIEYEIDIEECENEIFLDPAVQRFERIYEKTFNPNSTMQLRELFFKILQLKPSKKTESGAWSVDKEVLAGLNHPLSEAVLDLREKSKMLGTYISNIVGGIDKDSRLRSSFNIQGTTSGRLSSSGVLNYQNIPRDNKDIKKIFTARDGFKIVQCDLGAAEVYFAAALANDKFLQKAFIDKLDFHSYIAKQIFNLPCEVHEVKDHYSDKRQHAKAITFGIMYQAGPAKIAQTADITPQEAKIFINKYFREARELKRFIDASNEFIENNGYIYSFFGRKRRLPESASTNIGVAKHSIRSGVNFLVQSVASDINLLGVIDAMEWIKENKYQKEIIPFTVVHDSIVAEVKEDLIDEWIVNSKRCIQTDRGISIPGSPIGVDFEIGPSWGELEAYE